MAGLFSNPANWAITDTLQGQQGPLSQISAAGNSFTGASQAGASFSNPNGVTNSTNPASPPTMEGAIGYGADGTLQTYSNGQWVPFNQDSGAPTAQAGATGQTQAQIAETNRINNARNSFNSGRDVLNSSLNTRIGQEGIGYQRNLQDWVTGFNKSQTGLDTRGINAEMAKSQGAKGVLGMVGRGIKSGGVMLANRNAGDSSAAQAIASAYGDMGRRQMSGVNNAYGIEQNQIGLEQTALDEAGALQKTRFGEDKNTVINSIINDAQTQIAALNEAAAGAGIADRMDIAGEIERIRTQATNQLQQFDTELGKAKGAQSADQRRTEAGRLADLGQASNMDFGYSAEVPGQFQGTGPFASELPIFTYNRKNKLA